MAYNINCIIAELQERTYLHVLKQKQKWTNKLDWRRRSGVGAQTTCYSDWKETLLWCALKWLQDLCIRADCHLPVGTSRIKRLSQWQWWQIARFSVLFLRCFLFGGEVGWGGSTQLNGWWQTCYYTPCNYNIGFLEYWLDLSISSRSSLLLFTTSYAKCCSSSDLCCLANNYFTDPTIDAL